MNDAIHLKYLVAGPNDLLWGTAVNSVGFQEVGPGEPYPRPTTLPATSSPKSAAASWTNTSSST